MHVQSLTIVHIVQSDQAYIEHNFYIVLYTVEGV